MLNTTLSCNPLLVRMTLNITAVNLLIQTAEEKYQEEKEKLKVIRKSPRIITYQLMYQLQTIMDVSS